MGTLFTSGNECLVICFSAVFVETEMERCARLQSQANQFTIVNFVIIIYIIIFFKIKWRIKLTEIAQVFFF